MTEKQFTKEDAYKMNLIAIAEHHKRYCDGEGCSVSLYLLREMAERIGIKFTEEEAELFI